MNDDNDNIIEETEMAYFTKNLGVSTVIYTTVPIEYPATSPNGVATIFSIQGWKNHMDAFTDVRNTHNGLIITTFVYLFTVNIYLIFRFNILLVVVVVHPLWNVLFLVKFLLQNTQEYVKTSNIVLLLILILLMLNIVK